MKDKLTYIIFGIFVIGGLFLVLFMNYFSAPAPEDMAVSEFVEIDDYKGENFSKPSDFRENSIKGPQIVDVESYELKLTGLVNNETSLKYDEVLSNYTAHKKVATLNCVEGWSVKILWEGPLVKDILSEAGIKDEAKTIILKAVDGYSTSFPIEYLLDNNIIMAYNMNDEPLLPERGFPFQLVAESKWGYKWIKWINEIELSDNTDYKGYWEERGYSNSGDLDKPRFGD